MARRRDERNSDPLALLADYLSQRVAAKAAYQGVLDQRNSALMSVNEMSGERSRRYLSLQKNLDKDEQQLERIKVVVRRPISRMGVRPFVLVLIGIGLALLEAPANKFLFDVALQSSGAASYGASAAVTAFLLILAHFAGRGIRQVWSDYRRQIVVSSVLTFIVCIVVAAFIVGVLTVARAAFANEAGTIEDILKGVQGSVADQGPVSAVMAALSNTSALVLACINIGGIVVTLLLSFFAHDSDRDYDHAQANVDRGEAELAKIHQAYLKVRERTVRRFAPDLLGYVGNYNSANQRVVELKTRLDRPLDDDDRLVLTDLDRIAASLDRDEQDQPTRATPASPAATVAEPPGENPGIVAGAVPRHDPTVHTMSAYRRPTGTEET